VRNQGPARPAALLGVGLRQSAPFRIKSIRLMKKLIKLI
jgi:hypothetical protein